MSVPAVIEQFRVRSMRRAIFDDGGKLMTVGDKADEFFYVQRDPFEDMNLLDNPIGFENHIIRMENKLESFIAIAEAQRNGITSHGRVDYSDNPELLERLRGLGYIE
jgi:hypothetical protein